MSLHRHWSALSLDEHAAKLAQARQRFGEADQYGDDEHALRMARALATAAVALETAAASAAGVIDRMWADEKWRIDELAKARGDA